MRVVVPQRTSQTPINAHVGEPDLFSDKTEDIEISCIFTWDKNECERIAESWRKHGNKVSVGGPAYNSDGGNEFVAGKYVKHGIVHTSRGCPKRCPWCYVWKREGNIRELPIVLGNIIQDNNLFACTDDHIRNVFAMLKTQSSIRFLGGVDVDFLKDWHIENMRSLRIKEIWVAMDSKGKTKTLETIKRLVRSGFQNKIRCYALIGFMGETLSEGVERLCEIFKQGALPFAQIWDGKKKEEITKEWLSTARIFQRPAATKAYMRHISNEQL